MGLPAEPADPGRQFLLLPGRRRRRLGPRELSAAPPAAAAAAAPIEDYALIGDCKTAALVSRDGSIDWLCWPRFDSAACFAALLGTPEHGTLAHRPGRPGTRRSAARYRDGTLVLETVFETADGEVALIDFMPVGRRGVARRPPGAGPRAAASTCAWSWRCASTTAPPSPG